MKKEPKIGGFRGLGGADFNSWAICKADHQGPTKFFAAYKQISLIGSVPTKFTINSTTNCGLCLQAALACLPSLSGPGRHGRFRGSSGYIANPNFGTFESLVSCVVGSLSISSVGETDFKRLQNIFSRLPRPSPCDLPLLSASRLLKLLASSQC